MNFAATAATVGLAAVALVAHMQGGAVPAGAGIERAPLVDTTTTASLMRPASFSTARPATDRAALRFVDLRTGESCRAPAPSEAGSAFTPAPLGPDCASTPALREVTEWRANDDGTLEMVDAKGRTRLRFIPGDGALYESIYPHDARITVLAAHS